MKGWLFFAIGLVLLSLPAGLALADNGPHGGYAPTTDACAGCHRAHTSGAPRLLIGTELNLCNSCHGSTGNGADTNVVDGVYLARDSSAEVPPEGVTNRGLKGGGFVNALMDTDWDGVAAVAPSTSSHIVDGGLSTAWGNGAIGSGAGAFGFSLSCVSCHDPHGGASTFGGPTYRLLRAIPTGSGAASGEDVTDEASKLYTVSDTCEKSGNQYFGEGYVMFACDVPGETWSGLDSQESQLTGWCTQCHTRYLHAPLAGGSTAGSISSGDPIFDYRHRTRDTPVECADACHNDVVNRPFTINTWGGPMYKHRMSCMTCHVAHGSSASMAGYAGSRHAVPWPDGATTPDGNNRSSLLRVDNRGECQLCHDGGPHGSYTATTDACAQCHRAHTASSPRLLIPTVIIVDLTLTTSESIDPVIQGSGSGNLTYTVTVGNNGPSQATGLTLSEALTLPSGVTVESITPSAGTSYAPPDDPNGTWTVGALDPGATATMTVVLTADETTATGTDVISNTVTVTAVTEANDGATVMSEATSVAALAGLAIPTQNTAGLVLLIILLGVGGVILIVRRT